MPRKQKQKKRSRHRSVAGGDVLAALRGGPLAWRDLVAATQRANAAEIKQLRLLVKGLERNGQIQRDHTGDYHAVVEEEEVFGVVTEERGRLMVVGLEVEDARRQWLRPGDRVSARVVRDRVRIVDVVDFSEEPLVGVLRWRGRYPYVESLSRSYKGRVSLFDPPPAHLGAKDGDTVTVRIVDRDRRGLVGQFLQLIESESVVDQAIRTTIQAFAIPHRWPESVEGAVKKLPKSVAAGRHSGRVDLRELPLVTIDGETAKDFDDAVFAERDGRGWRLVVAIADVSHYVKPGSAIDQEAELRGTSVYFPGHVVPMLPEALSNELCSLKPKVPRLAMVCDMHVTQAGNVTRSEFMPAVIESHSRLTYTEAQKHLDGARRLPDAVGASIDALNGVFGAFRKARDKRGGLDFTSREGIIAVRAGRVAGVDPVRRLAAHQLIEEAMIAANVEAARFLEANESTSLYRVHAAPEPLKLEELRQALAVAGVVLPSGRPDPKVLQAALERLRSMNNAWVYEQLVLRSMTQAIYTPENKGHFGLALERYMHFTSPIRRYPDLLVHRAIKHVLGVKRWEPSADRLLALGEETSFTERRAESAGWAVDAWLKCDHLRARIGDVVDGVIAGVTDFGVFVDITGYFVQGLLHISELGSDYFHYLPHTASLVGEKSGRRFGLGDALRVKIVDVDPPPGRIDLQLARRG